MEVSVTRIIFEKVGKIWNYVWTYFENFLLRLLCFVIDVGSRFYKKNMWGVRHIKCVLEKCRYLFIYFKGFNFIN